MPSNYTNYTGSIADRSQFQRLGHPGRYTQVFTHGPTSVQSDFTGSNYGYGAIMIGSGSGLHFGAADFVELSGGGTILCRDLKVQYSAVGVNASPIIELSVMKIRTTDGAPSIYVLKRQQ